MSYQLRLHDLEEAHETLTQQVNNLQGNVYWNDYQLNQLKKEKLRIKDEIYRIQKLDQGPDPEDTDYYDSTETDDY